MSADFWFGVVIGAMVLLIGVAALLIWAKDLNESVAERSLEQLRLSNRLHESRISVLQGMSGWLGELVEVLKDANDPRCSDAEADISPPSGDLAAVLAAVGEEDTPSGGLAGGGDVFDEPLNEAQVRAALGWVAARCKRGVFAAPAVWPGALFDLAMKYDAAQEARAGAREQA